MATDSKLVAKIRDVSGSGAARRMRRAGTVPAVLNNHKCESQLLELNTHAFDQMLRHHAGENLILDLVVEDREPKKVLLTEVQRDNLTGAILHADLMEISMTEKIQISVPIELVGEAHGVHEGGMLDHLLRTIDVECLPGDVVDCIEVDVTRLGMSETYLAGDVSLPEGMTLVTAPDVAVAAVLTPRVDTSAAEEEEAEGEGEAAEGAEGEGGAAEGESSE